MKLSRIEKEKQTVARMVACYCRGHHAGSGPKELCPDCQNLLEYACDRLDHCPFGEDKPVCARCKIHCYRPERREQIRRVMRYAGPRMLLLSPLAGIDHLLRLIKDNRNRNR